MKPGLSDFANREDLEGCWLSFCHGFGSARSQPHGSLIHMLPDDCNSERAVKVCLTVVLTMKSFIQTAEPTKPKILCERREIEQAFIQAAPSARIIRRLKIHALSFRGCRLNIQDLAT